MKLSRNLENLQNISRTLFYVIGFIWLFIGLRWLLFNRPEVIEASLYLFVMGFYILGNALLFFLLGLLLRSGKKWTFLLSVFVLIINLGITFFRQFGIFDLIILLMNSILLVILGLSRKAYGFGSPEQES
jgi:hypothetical protein